MKIIRTRVDTTPTGSAAPRWKRRWLPPIYLLAAAVRRGPGISAHRRIRELSTNPPGGAAPAADGILGQLRREPLDSVRYFEFDFCLARAAKAERPRRLVDISSPRAFPLLLADRFPDLRLDLLNPDVKDLEATRTLASAWGVASRCVFHGSTVAAAELEPDGADIVSSISVVEHIADDTAAIRRMWELVRPGGRMLVTVPVAAEPFEEHMDIDEYGTSPVGGDGWSFAWRCYDEATLEERVFAAVGAPTHRSVYGERKSGVFFAARRRKWTDRGYPTWREPFMMASEFGPFPSIASLPGLGVIGLEWVKPAGGGL